MAAPTNPVARPPLESSIPLATLRDGSTNSAASIVDSVEDPATPGPFRPQHIADVLWRHLKVRSMGTYNDRPVKENIPASATSAVVSDALVDGCGGSLFYEAPYLPDTRPTGVQNDIRMSFAELNLGLPMIPENSATCSFPPPSALPRRRPLHQKHTATTPGEGAVTNLATEMSSSDISDDTDAKAQAAAEERKARRLVWARQNNELFLCKYLPIVQKLPVLIPPHAGPVGLSPSIIAAMHRAFQWVQPPVVPSKILFRGTHNCAEQNFALLRRANMDFPRFLREFGGTTCAIGSEFKPVAILEQVFGRHPLWFRARVTLVEGVDPDCDSLTEEERLSDLEEALSRGNHKSASSRPTVLEKLMSNDITYGYGVPFPRARALDIPGLVLLPAGIALQNTISEQGEIIPKERLTHDQSFCYGSKKSWNSRVHRDTLTHLRYGKALSRLIHYIVDFRHSHPTTPLFLSKSDYKAAYRRLHQAHRHALQCGLIFDEDIIIVLLRMSFGGAPNPNYWSDISEMACDLVNELLCSRDWCPEEFQHVLPFAMPEPDSPNLGVPLAAAVRPSVRIEINEFGICEVFLDDMILVVPDLFDNLHRARSVLALVITLLERPVSLDEWIKRDPLLSFQKFRAEGKLTERQTILGWVLDTRSLVICLPQDKAVAWSNSIHAMIETGKASLAELETLDGRLTHLGMINQGIRHFNGDVRHAVRTASRRRCGKNTKLDLSARLLQGSLPLWLRIIERARTGFDMNNLVFRDPTRIHSADASTFGIGVVNFSTGEAYRWELPEHLRFSVHINLLEFAASILGLLLDETISSADCVLSKTDNTSAEGWLGKTNFAHDEYPVHASLAELLGQDLMSRNYCLYSQHWPGVCNTVCDSLSRDFHLSDDALTSFLHFACPEKLPPRFRICALPNATVSRICSLLRTSTAMTPSPKAPTRSEIWLGKGGAFSALPLTSITTSSSMGSAPPSESFSLGLSPNASAKAPTPQISNPMPHHSWPTPSRALSSNWQRPSRMLSGPIRDTIPTVESVPFYCDNGAATEIKTALRLLRKPSHAACSEKCGNVP